MKESKDFTIGDMIFLLYSFETLGFYKNNVYEVIGVELNTNGQKLAVFLNDEARKVRTHYNHFRIYPKDLDEYFRETIF